jgi:4-aminobutyrate aminotransferase-like enzyme
MRLKRAIVIFIYMKSRYVRSKSGISSSVVAHGDFIYRHKPVPVFVESKGTYLEDSDGYRYLDAEAANGTANLGFDATILNDSLRKVSQIPSMPSFCETNLRLKVADRLVKLLKKATGDFGRIAFEIGGAQAVELAVKIVKSNSKKSQFAVFEGGYHGRSIFTSQLSASNRYRAFLGDARMPIIRLPYPDPSYLDPTDPEDFVDSALKQIRRMTTGEMGGIMSNNGRPDIAALIVEPVLNAGGIVKPPKRYFESVVKMFRELGAIIVFDEIFCGFHRSGPMFGFELYDVKPDLVILSKALTNGLVPLSCVWARNPYLLPKNFTSGTHSATFINNSLSLAVADTVLDRYGQWKDLPDQIDMVKNGLEQTVEIIKKVSSLVKSVDVIGAMARIELKKPIAGTIDDLAMVIARRNPVKGVHGAILASTGLAPHVIALNPSLTFKPLDFDILQKLLVRTFINAERIC